MTEKTTYLGWDKPVFPSDNLAGEIDALFDQIDVSVNIAAYTDAEAVTAVNAETSLSVDVTGDADTLDGKHASELARPERFIGRINAGGGVSVSANSWQKMPYNHETENTISGATFDTTSNELTLPAGTYDLDCRQTPYGTDDVTWRLYDPVNNTEICRGSTGYSSNSGSATIEMVGPITLSQDTTMIIQLYPKQSSSWAAGVVRNNTVPNGSWGGVWKVTKL